MTIPSPQPQSGQPQTGNAGNGVTSENSPSPFSRITNAAKKAINPSKYNNYPSVNHGIAAAVMPGIMVTSQGSNASDPSQSTRVPSNPDLASTPVDPSNSDLVSSAAPIRRNIFPFNVHRNQSAVPVVQIGDRIMDSPQLVLCASIIARAEASTTALSSSSPRTMTPTLSNAQLDWAQDMDSQPLEKEHIQQQLNRMVNKFIEHPSKDSETIKEVALLGPVLDKEYYRKLLNCFLGEFKNDTLLNINILQGLVQLVDDASPGFLMADDLTQILRTIRVRMQDPAQKLDEYLVYLTIAVSKVLNAMVDDKVAGLNRVQEHEPLLNLLSDLRNRGDPFLKYQALYAFQALQWVPNDETPLQCGLRRFGGVVDGLVKVSGAAQLDFGGFLGGLKDIQKIVADTYDFIKSGWEEVPKLMNNGRGVFDSLKEGLGSGYKHPWYITLRGAEALVRQGKLSDLNVLVCEAPCRNDPLFRWGICRLLGEIAIDSCWDRNTRVQAVWFLGELYSNMQNSQPHAVVRRWIITILRRVSVHQSTGSSTNGDDAVVNEQARLLTQILEQYGETALPNLYPLASRLPLPRSSSLLKGVNDNPDLDLLLDRLRRQRWNEYDNRSVYIQPMCKPSLQATDDRPVPLKERVRGFLTSTAEVLLILGDSGAGKSTFNRRLERDLWQVYKTGELIPLLIDLKTIENPDQDLVGQQLSCYDFSPEHIRELKQTRRFILICDGYDECRRWSNLHTNNGFNKPSQWRVKMIVTCRTQYLKPNYQSYFAPQLGRANTQKLFEEAVLAPFKADQIMEYIDLYTLVQETLDSNDDQLVWTSRQYKERLQGIPNLLDLVKNPFLLRMVLDTLPRIALSKAEITRAELYDEFVELHIENEQQRLVEQQSSGKMDASCSDSFDEIEGYDYILLSIDFSKRLAESIFKEQGGVNSVDYSAATDGRSWKNQFFGSDPRTKLLRGSSQLVSRVASQDPRPNSKSRLQASKRNSYEFSHRSFLEYFFSRSIFDPQGNTDRPDLAATLALSLSTGSSALVNHLICQRNLASEPSIIRFLADRVRLNSELEDQLYSIINLSKTNAVVGQAAANAISILIRAGVEFNGADLRGINIPGANLSGGHFDSAQLQGADLSSVNLSGAWLRMADLSGAQMTDVVFGEKPFLETPELQSCAISLDGKTLATGYFNAIRIYDPTNWNLLRTFSLNQSSALCVSFSKSGSYLASGGNIGVVRVWNLERATENCRDLEGHSGWVVGVTFSPNGLQVASCSDDESIRIWDLESATTLFVLTGHTNTVSAVDWSPCGTQIASASHDGSIRLWNPKNGRAQKVLFEEPIRVQHVAYCPDGSSLVASCEDKIRVWNLITGDMSLVLGDKGKGHHCVAFSPDGQKMVSSCSDRSVQLWDASTGSLICTWNGHSSFAISVHFLNDQEIASAGSKDGTVRLWSVESNVLGHGSGMTALSQQEPSDQVCASVYSHDGKSIIFAKGDGAILQRDLGTGSTTNLIHCGSAPIGDMYYTSNSRQMVIARSDLEIYDIHHDGSLHSAQVEPYNRYTGCYAISPCGRWKAYGAYNGSVTLHDRLHLRSTNMAQSKTRVDAMVFSPSGHQLAGWNADGLLLWDRNSGYQTQVFNYVSVKSVVYSPRGDLIAIAYREGLVLWDLQEKKVRTYLPIVVNRITKWTYANQIIAWSPCQRWIAWVISGDADGKKDVIQLWKDETATIVSYNDQSMSPTLNRQWNCKVAQDSATETVTKDGEKVQVSLTWGVMPNRFVATGADITDAIGLDSMQIKLLKQHQAIDRRPN
ncbi:hypothetical protein BGZ83_002610 [Gryganskiella cystojenkinii]|nr:hypothetical protein BGZ83_002610 [Gryganskiella cystojenkinii]